MDYLSEMQSYQPEFYLGFLEMQEILKASAKMLDKTDFAFTSTIDNAFVTTLNIDGVTRWENILDIMPVGTLDERRRVIISKLRGLQKLSASRIREIANAYKNGDVLVEFKDSTIFIKYASVAGIPSNFKEFENIIEQLKPAHLGVEFIFLYMWWDKFDSYDYTWDKWDTLNLTWDEWEGYIV